MDRIVRVSKPLIASALRRVHPETVIPEVIRRTGMEVQVKGVKLSTPYTVFSSGKGAAEAALAIMKSCNGWGIEQVIVVHKEETSEALEELKLTLPYSKLITLRGDHPYPGARSAHVYDTLQETFPKLKSKTLLATLHGGTSSLLYYSDLVSKIRKLCLTKAVKVEEINAIFRELSPVSGGGLMRLCKESGIRIVHVLGFSDVSGDQLYDIGSGPFEKNPTVGSAKNILERYGIWNALEENLKEDALKRLSAQKEVEMLPGLHEVVSSKREAIDGMRDWAEKNGYATKVLPHEFLNGVLEKRAEAFLEECKKVRPSKKPTLVFANGESVITVKGSGEGGRARHSAAIVTKKCPPHISGFFLGTDGSDGPKPKEGPETAGAFFGKAVWEEGVKKGLNLDSFIENSNTGPYFRKTNYVIVTGPTGVNVSDIAVGLIEKK